ncbi:sterol O-acyltransferase 1-like protein, partial [Leptotrombidium deliense]
TKERSLQRVLLYFVQFFGTLFCIFGTLRRFIKNFETVGLEAYTASKFAYLFGVGGCVGILFMFMGWFGLLQCWMNAWAELLRFGDRMFYDEWWTTQYSKYFRKWNLVVSDWLLTYTYCDIYKTTRKGWLAALVTFILSGVFHEYIVTLAWGFYLPIMFVMFLGFGVIMFFLHRNMKESHNGGNMFMFGSMFIGWSLLIMLYSLEWYSRVNCQPVYNSIFLDKVIPRMISCVKVKF